MAQPKVIDVEDLHLAAVRKGESTYIDPKTGFSCFTELFHLERGNCCGNRCRHCPYGLAKGEGDQTPKPAKVRSGDTVAIRKLLSKLKTDDDSTKNREIRAKEKKKNVPYTRKGDKGTAQLGTGERRSKTDLAFQAMGTVDELCTVVGVAHSHLTLAEKDGAELGEMGDWLLDIMSRLFDVGSHIARPPRAYDSDESEEDEDAVRKFSPDGIGGGFDARHIEELEAWIDLMTDDMPELRSFILPTGSLLATQLHMGRTVCRRAERTVVPLVKKGDCDPNAMKYLNRLSDFFFTAARWSNFCEGHEEIQYRRPEKGSRQRSRITTQSLNGSNRS